MKRRIRHSFWLGSSVMAMSAAYALPPADTGARLREERRSEAPSLSIDGVTESGVAADVGVAAEAVAVRYRAVASAPAIDVPAETMFLVALPTMDLRPVASDLAVDARAAVSYRATGTAHGDAVRLEILG